MIKKEGRMYGYELTKQVKESTNGAISISEGALYPVLHKLENSGLLESEMIPHEGRLRKYYSLSEKGKQKVAENSSELEGFLQGLQTLFNLKPSFK